MNRRYKLVVFDWEGTIGEDALGRVLNILAKESIKLQLGEIDKFVARQYVALGLPRALNKIRPDLNSGQLERLLLAVQDSMARVNMEEILIPGAKEAISALHSADFLLGVATNKSHVALERAMQLSGLTPFFTITRSASQTAVKPCPLMLEEIMAFCAVDSKSTVMIGDSVTDMEMATAIGVDAIGLDFYGESEAELLAAGALIVFNDYEQVTDYLRG